jgi:phytoene dehydrogenase-like protein
LLPALLTSTGRRIRRHVGRPSERFARFVDEQLLITAQAFANEVPFAVGAMCLSYTNLGNHSAPGGVGALADALVRAIRDEGGEVRYGRPVERISRDGEGYLLETRRGDVWARGVVSNLTVWDMARVCDGEIGAHFRGEKRSAREAWGAVTLYLGVEDTFGDEAALHHQVIFDDPLPIVGGRSVFVSLSPRGETARAPEGFRAVTISTHTDVEPWWTMERERYDAAKEEVAEAILERIASGSGLGRLRVEARLEGTPRTFVRYTHRERGRVGGLPSTFATTLAPRAPVTPFDDLYLVGDTVYPGQGLPAVVLGALNVVDRIASSKRVGATDRPRLATTRPST